MTQAKGYVDPEYLRAAAEVVRRIKERSYLLMEIAPGARALDVGCGPGIDTVALAALVGPDGQVAGVDADPGMVAAADAAAGQAGVAGWVRHQVGDARSLPFPADSFAAVRSERLFQHLPDPAPALTEMVRVIRPGGRVVVLDTDWGTLSIDTPEIDLERRLSRLHADHALHNGYAGRQLYRLFREQGLQDIAIEIHPNHTTSYALTRAMARLDEVERAARDSGALTAEEQARWQASLAAADAAGTFFAQVNLVLVVGRKG